MNINWLGHSCFKISGRQATVITDPFSPSTGYTLGKQSAHIVTVSHQHEGHACVESIGGEPRIVSGPGEYEIGGVLIIGISTYHDAVRGSERGKNTIYLIEIDGISVCHLGDIGHVLTAEQVEELDNVDVLLLPVGGVSTINASVAAQVARQLVPKVVIPMHYQTPVLKWQLEPVEKYLNEVGATNIISQPKLSLTRPSIPETTQVYLLEY